MVAHTGLEPVISALRGQRVNQLHQCALMYLDYRGAAPGLASEVFSKCHARVAAEMRTTAEERQLSTSEGAPLLKAKIDKMATSDAMPKM